MSVKTRKFWTNQLARLRDDYHRSCQINPDDWSSEIEVLYHITFVRLSSGSDLVNRQLVNRNLYKTNMSFRKVIKL